MQISREATDDVLTLSLTGRLDELATTDVEQAFTKALNEDSKGIIIDLAGVEYISSSGLRILLMLSKAMKKQQRPLRLCSLSPFVAEVFEISNFSAMFEIHDTLNAARLDLGTSAP
jgi:anti-anti-sigma factor